MFNLQNKVSLTFSVCEITRQSSIHKLPYLGNVLSLFEKKVKELTQSTYNQV